MHSDEDNISTPELNMRVNRVLSWVEGSRDTILDFCASELLGLKNESWLGDGEDVVSADEFRRRLRLEGIGCHPGGWTELWFQDGDLFWGHTIVVHADAEFRLREAEIAG